jgi:hypothetical protein
MAKAVRKPTPTIDWILLSEARKLVAEAFHSTTYAEQWLVEQLMAKRVRWQPSARHPADASVDGFWERRVNVDWHDSNAIKRQALPIVGFEGVTMYGIQVAREDIEALLPGALGKPTRGTQKAWLVEWANHNPRKFREQMSNYAQRARAAILADPATAGKKWRAADAHSLANQLYKLKLGNPEPRRR